MGAVAELFAGPIDVVGDVHGEIDALRRLLDVLGYGPAGTHPRGRRLVFVGDLLDRGPDSPAVLRLVSDLVGSGRAQAVVGNHELNALRDDPSALRAGEDWWYGRPERVTALRSTLVDSLEKQARFLPFLRDLPVALEREDLRVVHAVWEGSAIEALRPTSRPVIDEYHHIERERAESLTRSASEAREAVDRFAVTKEAFRDETVPLPYVPELARHDERVQMGNPVRILTSGVERAAGRSYFAEKWRMTERIAWWDDYEESVPVVVGHYWRRYDQSAPHPKGGGADLFANTPPDHWLGRRSRVMCVDYSAGYRWAEREKLVPPGRYALAALRVPEWTVVFDDGRPSFQLGAPG